LLLQAVEVVVLKLVVEVVAVVLVVILQAMQQ
jgi:hypothetical protein